jgi:hypothetical protein
MIHEQNRCALPASSRTNADDRLPVDPLGRIEGGDGVVEGRDVADVRVAILSFGGPAGQIAVMHRILVEEKNWISVPMLRVWGSRRSEKRVTVNRRSL